MPTYVVTHTPPSASVIPYQGEVRALVAQMPMFPAGDFKERRLRLVSSRTYPSGVIELRYERAVVKEKPIRRKVR